MGKEIIPFGYIKNEKHKFHHHKNPILIFDVDINKIVVSSKISFRRKGFKYFAGQKDVKKIRPLSLHIPKISGYRRDFDETKYMSFL